MRIVPSLSFRLRHTRTIIVTCRSQHQVLSCSLIGTFRHHSRVKHYRQNRLVVCHTCFLASSHEPLLTKLRQELILAVVVMNTIREPHTLQVAFESLELLRLAAVRIVVIQRFQRPTDTQIIPAVLVKQDIASLQCRLAQIIDKRLLLNAQTIEARHVVTQNL